MPVDCGRIVGLDCHPLITELGCLVWKYANLQVKKWSKIDERDRNSLFQMLGDNFQVDDSQHVSNITHAQMNRSYRNFHHMLHKKYFKPHPTVEVALQHRPPGLSEEDWSYLYGYFSFEEYKNMSERNAKNRAKQDTPHIVGTKSFARIGFEMQVNDGKEPGPIQIYETTYYRGNGGASVSNRE
ncbi:uncharacterized protein LOC143854379 isoform X2 [Tasmannia lanceolata]|uniref:uncharacterized protein LOC143854379 isoform X2 n=1 Tax=Tasmannia lanceolata TaxID=3420 RepID=UPI004062884F